MSHNYSFPLNHSLLDFLKVAKRGVFACFFVFTIWGFGEAYGQTNDVGVSDILISEFGTTEFTAATTATVEVTNYGTADQTNVPISLILSDRSGNQLQTINETVPSVTNGSTIEYDFTATLNLSVLRYYKVTVATNLVGDENTANDESVKGIFHVSAASLPIYEDFEDVTSIVASTTPLGAIPGAPGFSFGQEVEGTRISFLDFQDVSDDQGSRLVNLDNPNTGGIDANFLYLTADLSAYDTTDATDDLVLAFQWLDYGDEVSADDRVWIRGNKDTTWVEVVDISGGTHGDWNDEEVNLSAALKAAGQNFSNTFQVRFGQEDNFPIATDGMAFDDIFLGVKTDLMVFNVQQSASDEAPVGFQTEDVITVSIKNLAVEDVSNFSITLTAEGPNGTETITETVSDIIATTDTLIYTFATGYDISTLGNYDVKVFTGSITDFNRSDDTVSTSLRVLDTYTDALPYFEDFESVTVSEYTDDVSAIDGVQGLAYIQSADGLRLKFDWGGIDDDGSQVATMDNPIGGGNREHFLYLSADLSAYDTATDRIGLNFNVISHGDEATANDRVWVRTHPDSAWTEVYDLTTITVFAWENIEVDLWSELTAAGLNYTATTQIRFGQEDTDAYASDGISFDDISLDLLSTTDVELVGVQLPDTRVDLDTDTVIVAVQNNAFEIIGGDIQLDLYFNDEVVASQSITNTYNDTLSVGETEFIRITGLDFAADGDYRVVATAIAAGDQNDENDSDEAEFSNIAAATFPLTEGFEGVGNFNLFAESVSNLKYLAGFSFASEDGNTYNADPGAPYVNTGDHAVALYEGNASDGELILSLDMASYDTTGDSIRFDFAYYDVNDQDDAPDLVQLRGHEDSVWIDLFDWNGGTENTWIEVSDLNVDSALRVNGQTFSSSTQIRFVNNSSNALGTDGLVIDDIRVYEQPGDDLALVATKLPDDMPQTLTGTDTIYFYVENMGSNTQTSYTVGGTLTASDGVVTEISEEFTGRSLATGDIDTVGITTGFDLNTSGVYAFDGYVSLTGDANEGNNTAEESTVVIFDVYAGTLPYSESFELISDGNWEEDLGFIPGLRNEGYSYLYGNGGRLAVRSDFDDDGQGMLSMDNPGGGGVNQLFFTVDLSAYSVAGTDPDYIYLDFNWYDHGDEGNLEDVVEIRMHPDSAWVEVYDFATNTNNNSWTYVTELNLGAFLLANDQDYSESFQIRFQQTDNFPINTDGISIDDVALYEYTGLDVGVASVAFDSESGIDIGDDTVRAYITNYGLDTLYSVPVSLEIYLNEVLSEKLTGTYSGDTLDPGETDTLIFVGADLSADGVYEATAFTTLTDDANADNDDATSGRLVNYDLATFPIDEGFENVGPTLTYEGQVSPIDGLTGWVHVADGTERLQFARGNAFDGSQAASLDSGANNLNQLILNVDMSAYDTTTDYQIMLDFAYNVINDENDAGDAVYFRTDADSAWTLLLDYNDGATYNVWQTASINITDALKAEGVDFTGTFQVLFQQDDDEGFDNDGVEFDNIQLYDNYDLVDDDLSVALGLPADGPQGYVTDSVLLFIANQGDQTQTAYDIYIKQTGPRNTVVEYSESITGANLDSGSIDTLYFVTQFDFSVDGSYNFEAAVTLADDSNSSNDSTDATAIVQSRYGDGLPFWEDFENVSDFNLQESRGFLPGLAGGGISYVYGSGGRIAIRSDFDDDGAGILSMDNPGGGGVNQAILALDLSGYSVDSYDYLALDFNWYDHGDEGNVEDVVEIRMHPDSAWVEIYDFGTNSNNQAWTYVSGLDLYTALVGAGQDYSDIFQIRFQQTDNFPINTDGISIDDIRVYEAVSTDISTTSVVATGSRVEVLDDTVRVTVTNAGFDTLYEYGADVEIFLNGSSIETGSASVTTDTLDPAESVTILIPGFDLSADGDYRVVATATTPGDEDDTNDSDETVFQNFVAASFPLAEGFEGVGTVESFTGPDATYGSPFRVPTLTGWTYEPSLINERLIFNNTGVSPYEGFHAAGLDGGNFGENALILTVDMSGYTVAADTLIQLSFWYNDVGDENGALDNIYVRGHEDSVWVTLFDWNTIYSYEWVLAKNLDVSGALAGAGQEYTSTFQIKFQQSDNFNFGTDGLMIDNVDLSLRDDLDLEVASVELPDAAPAGILTSDTVKVNVTNVGIVDVSSYDVEVRLEQDNGTVQTLTESVATTLMVDSTTQIDVTGFDFSSSGNYVATATITVASDGELTNNEGEAEVNIYSRYTDGLPFAQDFETAALNTYQATAAEVSGIRGEGISYVHTDGGRFRITQGYDDTDSRTATLDNTFGNNAFHYLLLTVDLSAYDTTSLDQLGMDFSFYSHNDGVNNEDSVWIRGSHEDEWIPLYDLAANAVNLNWVDVERVDVLSYLRDSAQNYSSTFQVRFGHAGDNVTDNDGLSFDDIRIYEVASDAGVTAIVGPAARTDVTADSVVLTIENFGVDTLYSVPAVIEVYYDGQLDGTYTGTYNDTINPADNQELTISGIDFSQDGIYTVKAYTTLEGDADESNDAGFDIEVANLLVASFPLFEGFENVGPTTTYSATETYEINGLPGWIHLADDDERVVFNPTATYVFSGNQAAVLDQGNFTDNQLILTVDLSAFDTTANADSVRLDFAYRAMDDIDDAEDKVFIRVHEDSSWVELFDWNVGIDDTWIEVSDISIDQVLRDNGLQFSSTTQIMFGQSDNASYGVDGLAIDNVRLYSVGETAPIDISLAQGILRELDQADKFVGTLSTADPNPEDTTFTYSLVAGTGDSENTYFSITGDSLWLTTDADFDFETSSTISIRVQSEDDSGLTYAEAVTIQLSNSNEGITSIDFAGNSVDDGAGNVLVGTLSSVDVDNGDQASFLLVSGSGDDANSRLKIIGNQVYTKNVGLNFEDGASQSFRVQATDNGGTSIVDTFTITVVDVNDSPTDLALSVSSIAENTSTGTTVGTFTTTDQDAGDSHTYALVAGVNDSDNAKFSISGASLVLDQSVDFENTDDRNLSIRVQTTDNGGLTYTKVIRLTTTNVNEAPTNITPSRNTIRENNPNVSIPLSVTDPDNPDSFTLALVAGIGDTDNGSFSINGRFLVLNSAADFETQTAYEVRVQATDGGGNTFAKNLNFNVRDMNDRMSRILVSNSTLEENAGESRIVGALSNDDQDVDTYTYSLVAGEGDIHNDGFTIKGNQLVANRSFNFEAEPSLNVRVKVEAANGGDSYEEALTLTTVDQNDAPTVRTTLPTLEVTLGEVGVQSLVEGNFMDEDASDALTASLSMADGSILPAYLQLNAATGMLRVDATNLQEASVLNLVVTVTDGKEDVSAPVTVQLREGAGSELEISDFSAYISVYPNPTEDKMTLSVAEGAWDGMRVQVATMQGAIIEEFTLVGAEHELDLSNVASGAYLISITKGEEVYRMQIFKR